MMTGQSNNPIFFNKKKAWRPEHSLSLHPPMPNNFSFLS